MLENLHFVRPPWLLALLPLALLAWRAFASGGRENAWQNVVDARLMPLLQVGQAGKASRLAPWLLAAAWWIATLALAGPTWERRPQPVFQSSAARVVVLDLSSSMNAADLSPSRLVRARFEVEDVLAQAAEGQTGLVAYAGDAFTVSPLTRDANTIRSLLKVLQPGLMPADGERADLGLAKAGELLRQAGLTSGQVLLMADGVDAAQASATDRAAARLRSAGYTVSVIGIGTEAGAPVAGEHGQLERDVSGKVRLSRLETAALRSVAHAGGGDYRTISDDGTALRALLAAGPSAQQAAHALASAAPATWKEQGPWLVLLLLPLAALAFRRNWLVGLTLAGALTVASQAAEAATWREAWQRPDQQAAQALAAGDYGKAAKAAAASGDPALRGSAAYKLGDYQSALDHFSHSTGADADYNRGNALARLGRYQDAMAAYDKSLAERPVNDDARANKAAVEALLKQQQQQNPSPNAKGGGTPPAQGKDKGQGQGQGHGQDSTAGAGQPDPSKPSKGQSAKGDPNPGASSPRADESASAKAGQGEPPLAQPDHSGQAAAGKPATPSPQVAGNAFDQAVKKLASNAQPDRAGTEPSANGTSAAGKANPGDASRAGHEPASTASSGPAQPLQSEERLAAEQWLRRIPDDPGGLLRRKFLYQYRQHQQGAPDGQ